MIYIYIYIDICRRNWYPQLVYAERAIRSRASIFTHVRDEWLRKRADPLTSLSKIPSFSRPVLANAAFSWTFLLRERKGQFKRARLIADTLRDDNICRFRFRCPFLRFWKAVERAALSGCRITWRVLKKTGAAILFTSCFLREWEKFVNISCHVIYVIAINILYLISF